MGNEKRIFDLQQERLNSFRRKVDNMTPDEVQKEILVQLMILSHKAMMEEMEG